MGYICMQTVLAVGRTKPRGSEQRLENHFSQKNVSNYSVSVTVFIVGTAWIRRVYMMTWRLRRGEK